MSDQPVTPGSVLVSCTLSPVVTGIIQTSADGHERLWRLDDPDRLRGHLGRGLIARTLSGPGRYREAGLVDEQQGVLVLPARFPDQDGRVGAIDVVPLRPVHGNAIAEIEQAKREVAMAVHQSIPVMLHDGGAVMLEPTNPDTGGSRWVRIFRRESELSVWTSPQPNSEVWRPVLVGDGEARAIMPLGESAAHDAAVLAASAFADWECSPWDVCLTFVPYDELERISTLPPREQRPRRRGLFGRRGRQRPESSPSPVTSASVARSSISAVQGHMCVVPLGGAHWIEARLGLGPWAARIVLDVDRREFRCESEIPGVVDTSAVERAVGSLSFEAPRAAYASSPGPTVVTLAYVRALEQVNPAVVRDTALLLARATATMTHALWDGLAPMERARLRAVGMTSQASLDFSPEQMLLAEPTPHGEWDGRLAVVDTAPPAQPNLPPGVAGMILGPLESRWASTVTEIREVLDQFTATMAIEVQRRDRDDEVYVQLARNGDHALAEAVSNTFLEGASRLNSTEIQRLGHLGWQPPAGDDDPNWSRSYDLQNSQDIAEHIATTLRDAYGADPENDGWLIKWTDPDNGSADAPHLIPIASPAMAPRPHGKSAQQSSSSRRTTVRHPQHERATMAPEISNALRHLRDSLGAAFEFRERPLGGFDLVTTNGHVYGVAEHEFIRLAVNSSALMRYGRGWGTTSVNPETGKKEWTVRADEFDLDRGDLGRLVGMVEGAKRWLEIRSPEQRPPEQTEVPDEVATTATTSLGVKEIALMLRSSIQDGTGTHLDAGSGFVRWHGDPKQGLLAEAGGGQPGTPIDSPLADALVSVGWSRPRPQDGLVSCWVELMLGVDEPEARFSARLEAVAEVVFRGISTLSEVRDG